VIGGVPGSLNRLLYGPKVDGFQEPCDLGFPRCLRCIPRLADLLWLFWLKRTTATVKDAVISRQSLMQTHDGPYASTDPPDVNWKINLTQRIRRLEMTLVRDDCPMQIAKLEKIVTDLESNAKLQIVELKERCHVLMQRTQCLNDMEKNAKPAILSLVSRCFELEKTADSMRKASKEDWEQIAKLTRIVNLMETSLECRLQQLETKIKDLETKIASSRLCGALDRQGMKGVIKQQLALKQRMGMISKDNMEVLMQALEDAITE
jgi:hypothetical protein